jgi:hypothetical protein
VSTGAYVPTKDLTVAGMSTFATTTAFLLNGEIVVDGTHFAKTSTGIQQANDTCYVLNYILSGSCRDIFLRNGTYDITAPISLSTSTVLIGESQTGVVLLQNASTISSMVFAMLQAKTFTAPHVTIENMTIDGNYDNLLSHPGNAGQLLGPADYWDMENLTLQNANSFYSFPNGTHWVTYRYNTFQSTGVGGTGNDILGGGGNYHMDVEYNTWMPGLHGNMFDNVNGDDNNLSHNHFLATNRGVYFEGMTRTTFIDNETPGLTIESDNGYQPAFIHNATGTIAMYNRFTTNGAVGASCINLQYTSTTTGLFSRGGQNIITNNDCTYGQSGVVKAMNTNSADGGGDIISDNNCYDINPSDNENVNNGLGVFHPSCINIMQGATTTVNGNTVVDDRTPKYARYVVSFGAGGTAVFPNYMTAIGNAGQTASGTIEVRNSTATNVLGIFDGVSTTTSTNGVDISGGCFAFNGVCLISNGLVRVYQTATTTCSASIEGSMFYNSSNKHFWGCDGTNWNRLDN